jgi:hypothetical protein
MTAEANAGGSSMLRRMLGAASAAALLLSMTVGIVLADNPSGPRQSWPRGGGSVRSDATLAPHQVFG